MTTIVFGLFPVTAYQSGDINYNVQYSETRLLSGDIFVDLSTHTLTFPRKYDCHTDSYTEISDLAALIGTFQTLVIDGVSYQNCYIVQLGGIKELILGSGKYIYNVTFGQADKY